MKSESEKLYAGKKKKVFFSKKDRDLWVRLNAEHIRHANKVVNQIDKEDLGSIETVYSPLWISNNQLTYDEYMEDQPRLSLEELSSMNHDDLLVLSEERNKVTFEKIFEGVFDDDDEDFIVYGGDEDFI